MNQHKIFRVLLLINELTKHPKSIRYLCDYLQTSERSVYRYIELFRELGYEIIKVKPGYYQIKKPLNNINNMSLTLFNIKEEYRRLAESIIESGGELTPDLDEALQINQTMLQEKAANYGYIIKQAEYEIDMLDAEIERLKAYKNDRQKMADRLKEKISDAMELYGIEKIESGTIKLSFRKSDSVEISDESAIPAEYLVVQPVKISKSLIKDSLKNGIDVPGASLVTKFNLQIK
jgi:biotin operon repressor